MSHRRTANDAIASCAEEHDLPIKYDSKDPGEPPIEFRLRLRRFDTPTEGAKAVIILHGANSSSDTFLVPNGGLARFLAKAGWDVWLLDWRGSPHVMAQLPPDRFIGGSVVEECKHFNYDTVAAEDIPEAVAFVRRQIGESARLSVIGHCVGGGITAMAIASGAFEKTGIDHFVLVALALFYEVPWDGWIKAEDYILERILAHDKQCRAIDPTKGAAWPDPIKKAYERWPCPWLPDDGSDIDLLKRVTFMVGQPWAPELLAKGLSTPVIAPIFGPLHMGIYLHCGQMVRRGYAAPFEAIDQIDRSRLALLPNSLRKGAQNSYLIAKYFADKHVTLVTGSDNRVWHRDSMDLMYDWLRNVVGGEEDQFRKCVVPGFGLQDLFWRESAEESVWKEIEKGL